MSTLSARRSIYDPDGINTNFSIHPYINEEEIEKELENLKLQYSQDETTSKTRKNITDQSECGGENLDAAYGTQKYISC